MAKVFDFTDDFSAEENWGNAELINPLLILTLQQLRTYINTPIHINNGYATSGHSKNSQHYKGNAVDCKILDIKFIDAIDYVLKFLHNNIFINYKLSDICGLGIYPDWHSGAGFHIDVRGYKARWGAVYETVNNREVQKYISFDKAFKVASQKGT